VSEYVCPVCRKPMLSADMLCSGSFLDRDHPANVASVLRDPDRHPPEPPKPPPAPWPVDPIGDAG
jgi:hypothetical protein